MNVEPFGLHMNPVNSSAISKIGPFQFSKNYVKKKPTTNRIISQIIDELKIKCGFYVINKGKTIELHIVYVCLG